jgi:hypothetical protein
MIIHTRSQAAAAATPSQTPSAQQSRRKERDQTGHGEEHGGRNCPALRLIGEPPRSVDNQGVMVIFTGDVEEVRFWAAPSGGRSRAPR